MVTYANSHNRVYTLYGKTKKNYTLKICRQLKFISKFKDKEVAGNNDKERVLSRVTTTNKNMSVVETM